MAKKHFEYGNIRFSIDTCNGEITGLENLVMGDNIVKNTMTAPEFYGHQPFTITLRDENGEEKNHFKKVNIINFAKYVDQMKRIGVRIVEGKEDSNYDSWIIYKME